METMGRRARAASACCLRHYDLACARDFLQVVDVLGFTPMETLVAATRLG